MARSTMETTAPNGHAAGGDDFREKLIELIPFLRAFARTLCGHRDEADDLCQEALAKAWQSRGTFEPGTNLKAWLFMILRNQFYSDRRRSWRSTPLDPETAERTLVATTDPNAGLQLDEVRRAMTMLPDDQREALILIGAGGFSYEEVAEICNCAVGTVKSRVSRARDRLALILAEGSQVLDETPPSAAMSVILSQLDALSAVRRAA